MKATHLVRVLATLTTDEFEIGDVCPAAPVKFGPFPWRVCGKSGNWCLFREGECEVVSGPAVSPVEAAR